MAPSSTPLRPTTTPSPRPSRCRAIAWLATGTWLAPVSPRTPCSTIRNASPPSSATPSRRSNRDRVFSSYNDHFRSGLHLLREIDAVASLAREWHGRVPFAVASNGRRLNVQASLRVTGLLPLFDLIVSADDVAHGKPAPDVFLEAAHRMGVAPSDCIVLADSDEGLAAARAAHMRSVDVRRLA